MDCQTVRIALSARLDGEPMASDGPAVDDHVRACAGCAGWVGAAESLAARVAEVAERDHHPDLVAATLGAAATTAAGPWWRTVGWRRIALAGIAVAQLVLAASSLSAGDEHHAHHYHELGAWEAALAVGLLAVAWRPARAWGMLPLVAAVVLALAVATTADVIAGQASFGRELSHLLAVVALVVLRPLAAGTRPTLRLVRTA